MIASAANRHIATSVTFGEVKATFTVNSFQITEFKAVFYFTEVTMKRISILLLVFCTCFGLAAWPQTKPPTDIITFDVPGAGTASGEGTMPVVYRARGLDHGVLR